MEEINESTKQTPLLLYRNCDISQEHLSDIPLNQCIECMVFTGKTGCFVFLFSVCFSTVHLSLGLMNPEKCINKNGLTTLLLRVFFLTRARVACFKTSQELDLLTSFPRLRQKNLAIRQFEKIWVSKKLETNKELHSLRIHCMYGIIYIYIIHGSNGIAGQRTATSQLL